MSAKHSDYSFGGKRDDGFTLIELMITLVVGSIVALAAFSTYSLQSKTFSTQRQVSKVQQDMRGALYMMESDLLNGFRDPNMSGRYTMTDIRPYDYRPGQLDTRLGPSAFAMPAAAALAAGNNIYYQSYPVLEFSALRQDTDGDGAGDTPVTIRYQICDFNNDGRPDLGRRIVLGGTPPGVIVGPPALVAEGVVAVGYAFAFNLNPNGKYEITRTPPVAGGDPLGNIIWAVDSDGDNQLDTNIDVTGDGQITLADDISGDGIINVLDNAAAALPAPVDIRNGNVVAVKIFLLLQSDRQSPENVIDTNQYVVADRIIPPPPLFPNGFQDRYKRRVKTVTVAFRNYRKS
ncbi:MAG: prepilin-type N-terminal cleavage/methylation domain-containing protein [Desulfobacteraceae bacterium]